MDKTWWRISRHNEFGDYTVMADIYLRSSDGSDGDDGSTWALAKATLAAAITAAGAGGRGFVSDNHAESAASGKTLSGGTINAPVQILSVNDSGNPEPPTAILAGGTVTTTGANDITVRGYLHFVGITLSSAQNILFTGAESKITMQSSTLNLSGATGNISIGSSDTDTNLILNSQTITFANAANEIVMAFAGSLVWIGGSLTGTAPSQLFDAMNRGAFVNMRDVDISGASGDLVDPTGTTGFFDILLERCKLHASLTVLENAIPAPGSYRVRLHSCDSGDTTYNIIEDSYEGTVIDETTIVKTSGASDGTTSQSLKMTSNANAVEFVQPLVSPPITAWTEKTASTTYSIEIIIDSATDLDDDEIWMEFEYPGADAQGDLADDRAADLLATPAAQATSTALWTTTGMSNPNMQKLSVTVTPGKIGPVTARVYLAKPSTTVYVNQLITES